MNSNHRLGIIATALCASIAIASPFARAQDSGSLESLTRDPNQWVTALGDYHGSRHSTLSQINASNAARLQVAWEMSTGTLRGQEGQPLVIGNVMYFESSYPNYVYALDLENVGKIIWKFAPEQDKFAPSVACCDVVNRGVAYAEGKIIAAALDTRVYALDAKSGKVIWSVRNGDPKLGQTMTSAPLVVKDKVIVGISGGEYGVRGYLTAYDLGSGKQVWRAYSVGPDADILFDPAKTIDGATQRPVGADSRVENHCTGAWPGSEVGGSIWYPSFRSSRIIFHVRSCLDRLLSPAPRSSYRTPSCRISQIRRHCRWAMAPIA